MNMPNQPDPPNNPDLGKGRSCRATKPVTEGHCTGWFGNGWKWHGCNRPAGHHSPTHGQPGRPAHTPDDQHTCPCGATWYTRNHHTET